MRSVGSSPLARGLPPEEQRAGHVRGIIPARAGFTCQASSTGAAGAGSSPLARGLRGQGRQDGGDHGIIPARAGFTPAANGSRASAWDHPRSRGVYRKAFEDYQVVAGSSPLARGLRPLLPLVGHGRGIIPARAGFTLDTVPSVLERGDHPRSRGVYTQRIRDAAGEGGSSPLARGLQTVPGIDRVLAGIIPARAGFTLLLLLLRARPRDHPRSRGVYDPVAALESIYVGSSPLARGLRGSCCGSWGCVRIIPARAGFTPTEPPATSTQQDHPRSRGVYLSIIQGTISGAGSSPLARGLPRRQGHPGPYGGIIPARAGFTGR